MRGCLAECTACKIFRTGRDGQKCQKGGRDLLVMNVWQVISQIPSIVSNSATPWTTQTMEFSRPEYWSGCPFPGDLPSPGMGPRSPALQVDSSPAELPGKHSDESMATTKQNWQGQGFPSCPGLC